MSDKNRMRVTQTPSSIEAINQEPSNTDLLSMEELSGRQTRTWNPDGYIYQLLSQRYISDTNQQLLVVQCGTGDVAIRLAMLGYDVYDIDPDPSHIDWARESALRHGVNNNTRFAVMNADNLLHDDERFDIIVGINALKQSELNQTLSEIHRTLKLGGTALFKEQIQTPLDTATAEDEVLNQTDLDMVNQTFGSIQTRRFTILSRLDHLIPRSSEYTRSALQKLDRKLLDLCPPMASLGATAVINCTKSAQNLTEGIQFAA